jgi:hypothetical protein
MSNRLSTLAIADLETVTGGAPVKGSGSGASSSSNSEISSALTGLQSSIKDLSSKPQQSAFGGTNLMLFAMLAMNRPAVSQTNVVYVRRRGCW